MARARWKLTYYAESRIEGSLRKTREAAMKALFDRLDMAQRDALSLDEQQEADRFGRMRGAMASSWRQATRGRTVGPVYRNEVASITREG